MASEGASEGAAETFCIKHIGNSFFHPLGGGKYPNDDTPIVLHPGRHENMHWRFVPQPDDHWGYIMHVKSEKVIHPWGGADRPGDDTKLVLHQTQKPAARFAFDETRNYIVHVGGSFVHPSGGGTSPKPDTPLVLNSLVNKDAMKFKVVSTSDPDEEVLVYGYPKLAGKWQLVYSLYKPVNAETATYSFKVGKSETESSSTEFKYGWEVSAGILGKAFEASTDASLEKMYQHSNSETWTTEVTKTQSITIPPGKTVAVWQFYFDVQQNLSKGIYNSDIFGQTNDLHKPPEDI